MKRLVEKLYYRSPVAIQNCAVSILGFKLRNERYGLKARRHLKELLETQYLGRDDLHRLQEQRFLSLARRAINLTPFYRDWAISEGIDSADVRSIHDLARFPIIEKETVRSAPERFIAEDADHRLAKLHTSGTSGTPLTVYTDSACRTFHYAFFSRLRGWFGVRPIERRATLFGRIIMRADQEQPPFWRFDFAQKNLLMSSYHLSPANVAEYYRKLAEYQPKEVIGYPSSLFQIAHHIVTEKLEPLRPRVVFATAETLMQHQRETIEAAFECPVVNQYGCTEMAFFASECESGTMHFHPEHAITEIVDEKGQPADAGSTGDLVATGLVNTVMPLIRYRVGDRLAMAERSCECGRAFPVISELEGRMDDVIYRRDGTPVGRLDPVFKGGAGIREAQIVQKQNLDIEVRIVPAADFTEEDRAWIGEELQKRLGAGIQISMVEVSTISRGAGGKFKAVVRE